MIIDICPSCRGVWPDRGELEKITERVREIRQPFNQWSQDDDKEYGERHERRT